MSSQPTAPSKSTSTASPGRSSTIRVWRSILKSDPAYSVAVFNVERETPAPRKDIVNWSDIERACGFYFDEIYEASISRDGYPMPTFDAADIAAILEHVRAFDPAVPKDAWLDDMRALAERLGFAPTPRHSRKTPARSRGISAT